MSDESMINGRTTVIRFALLVALLLAPSTAHAAVVLQLTATPNQIPADGVSTLTITAHVRDGGGPSLDGLVVFTTSEGVLEPIGGGLSGSAIEVPVQSGVAKAVLRSTTYETTAYVTGAVLGVGEQVLDRVEVVFGTPKQQTEAYDNIIRVRGNYLAYGPDANVQIMEVIGDAEVSYQGVEIRARHIQIDLQEYLLLARDYESVSIGRGPPPYPQEAVDDPTVPPYVGERLAVDLRTFSGAVYSAEHGQAIFFSSRDLKRQPDREITPGLFDLFELGEVQIWIKARSAAIYPNQRIRFDRAKFEVNGHKVLSLPYYFEGLGYDALGGPALTQFVSYSTQDGLLLDIPYYFDVGDRHTNEFRLTRGVRTGLFGRSDGLQFSYRHHADLAGDRGEYDFVVDDIGKHVGVSYYRRQSFGDNSFGTLSLAWPRHRNFYSTATLYTPMGPGNVSVNANVDYLSGAFAGITANTNLAWQSNPVRLKAIDSTLSTSLGLTYSRGLLGQDLWRQSLTFSFSRTPLRFGKGGSLYPYAGVRFNNTVNGDQEVAFTFNTSYRQQLNQSTSFSLGYTYDTAWNSDYSIPDRHLLTSNLQLYTGKAWNGYAFANYNLGDRTFSGSLFLDYALSRHWGVDAMSLYQSSRLGSFSETELSVYRVLGTRELRLRYSFDRSRLFFEIDNHF